MVRMFGATCNAAPVTRSVYVGTAQAVATSASATELMLFLFLDDDELHPPSWGVRRRRPENQAHFSEAVDARTPFLARESPRSIASKYLPRRGVER